MVFPIIPALGTKGTLCPFCVPIHKKKNNNDNDNNNQINKNPRY